MDYVSDHANNPFGMAPPCEEFVPGYGEATADFHVIGDHPGVHGGRESGIPFTDRPWSARFFDALADGGLVERYDSETDEVVVRGSFLSYLHPCVPADETPDEVSYDEMEPYFDAELRAITPDVLLPVGVRATAHALAEYTARDPALAEGMDRIHGTEVVGSGWLVVPVKEPARWVEGDARRLVTGLVDLRRTHYHRVADLGRFVAGNDPYYVR